MGRIDELFRLDGKVAVVSGGAGLIGSRLCDILVEAGASVVVVDQAEAKRKGIISKSIDITNESKVKELATQIYHEFGRCDVLINAAHYKGGAFFASLKEYPLDAWQKVMDVNLTGAFLMCREFGGRMFDSTDGGAIVNISSTYGVVSADPRIYGTSGINSPISYATTKSGLINFTRYLAVHWRPKVRANVLVPGGVEANQDPNFIRNYVERTPLGRMAGPDDYQGAILFMCSAASAYMTGAVVTVDGGWTAW
jgi:NAD(P)-dependent dehydrogenase (short-subunit alcohol dehydrogenase family)